MADGAVLAGSYEAYPLTVHGDVVAGFFEPYPPLIHGAIMVGVFGDLPEGTLPAFNPSIVSAVTRVQQNNAFPQFVIGGLGLVDNHVLFKKSDVYAVGEFPIWRSPVYRINKDFDVLSITFPLHLDMTAGVNILPKLYFDDGERTAIGTTINTTNFSNTNKLITLTAKNFSNSVHGQANFFLELQFLGEDLAVVGLPMTIEIDQHE